jgi:hypothetical protein
MFLLLQRTLVNNQSSSSTPVTALVFTHQQIGHFRTQRLISHPQTPTNTTVIIINNNSNKP